MLKITNESKVSPGLVSLIRRISIEDRETLIHKALTEYEVVPSEILFTRYDVSVLEKITIPANLIEAYKENPQKVEYLLTSNEVVAEEASTLEKFVTTVNDACNAFFLTVEFIAFVLEEVDSRYHLFLVKKIKSNEPFSLENDQDLEFVQDHMLEIDKALGEILEFVRVKNHNQYHSCLNSNIPYKISS